MDFENIEIGLLNENGTLPEKSAVLERFQEGLSARLKGEPAEEVSQPTLPESGGVGADDSEGQESAADSGSIDEVVPNREVSEVETAGNESTGDEESDQVTEDDEEGVTGEEDGGLVSSEDEVDTPEEQNVEGELDSSTTPETGAAEGDEDGSTAGGPSDGAEDEEVVEGAVESLAVDENNPEASENTAEKDYSNEWTPEELAELGEDT